MDQDLPWYVVEPATHSKDPLVQSFKRLDFLAIKVEQTLSMERSPTYEKCDDDGSYEVEEKKNKVFDKDDSKLVSGSIFFSFTLNNYINFHRSLDVWVGRSFSKTA